jgi:hypothetical protein
MRTSPMLAFGRQFPRETRPSQKCGGCGAMAFRWESLEDFCVCAESVATCDLCDEYAPHTHPQEAYGVLMVDEARQDFFRSIFPLDIPREW